MNSSPMLEVRRFKRRGEPYAVYYAPDLALPIITCSGSFPTEWPHELRLSLRCCPSFGAWTCIKWVQFRSLKLHSMGARSGC